MVQLEGHTQRQWEAGERKSEPEVRRAAWGTLGGKKQTVPRSELQAVVELLARTKHTEEKVTLWVDCEYVNKGMQKVKRMIRSVSSNADLWECILKQRSERRSLFVVRRIWRSHVEAEHIVNGCIPRGHAWGNMMADVFAKAGAKMHQVTPEQANGIEQIDKLCWMVLGRITRKYSKLLENAKPYVETQSRKGETAPWRKKVAALNDRGHNLQRCGQGKGWR